MTGDLPVPPGQVPEEKVAAGGVGWSSPGGVCGCRGVLQAVLRGLDFILSVTEIH